jgi:hypothetical protein
MSGFWRSVYVSGEHREEKLHRRLAQARRLAAYVHDDLTAERLKMMIVELEHELTSEAKDSNAPPSGTISSIARRT